MTDSNRNKQLATSEQICARTRAWVESVVIKHNFCPFARREVENQTVRYHVVEGAETELCLQALIAECVLLDCDTHIETTLVIFPRGFDSFEDFLDLVDIANGLLVSQDYEGIYQLANFHPEYQFAGVPMSDPGNYTNRSPYPMLHLIREESLDRALGSVEDPELIPERNMERARELGREALQAELDACKRAQP